MNVFFTCKNTLVILLQLYRLYVVYSESHKKTKKKSSNDFELSNISIISKPEMYGSRKRSPVRKKEKRNKKQKRKYEEEKPSTSEDDTSTESEYKNKKSRLVSLSIVRNHNHLINFSLQKNAVKKRHRLLDRQFPHEQPPQNLREDPQKIDEPQSEREKGTHETRKTKTDAIGQRHERPYETEHRHIRRVHQRFHVRFGTGKETRKNTET